MDKNLTDNEIVKALECCQDKNGYACDDCPYQEIKHFDKEKGFEIMPNGMTYDTLSCDIWLQKDTLDLINRLQARVEKSEKVEHFADKTIATLQAENERLKTKNDRLEHQLETFCLTLKLSKAEAYKEFAEKLKKEISVRITLSKEQDKNVLIYIDNLLKELVGEDNG